MWWLHPSCSLLYRCQNLWQHSSSPKVIWPPPFPLLQSVCLSVSLSRALLLSFCASSSWSGRSGARVAVATCPIPIAGWIIPGLCSPSHLTPHNAHTKQTHTCHLLHLCLFQHDFSSKIQSCHFLIRPPFLFICHSVSLSQPGQSVAAESDEISLYALFKWSYSQPCLCGISHNAYSAGKDRILQGRIRYLHVPKL